MLAILLYYLEEMMQINGWIATALAMALSCSVQLGEAQAFTDLNARSGEVVGRVFWEDSLVHPATVWAWFRGEIHGAADVDGLGNFRIKKLPRGIYRLMARDTLGRYAFADRVIVYDDSVTEVRLTIELTKDSDLTHRKTENF